MAILLAPEVKVDHYGTRTVEQWPQTIKAYGVGDGAFYSKHIRCGDPLALWLFARIVLGQGARKVKTILTERSLPDNTYYSHLFVGVRDASKFGIDPKFRPLSRDPSRQDDGDGGQRSDRDKAARGLIAVTTGRVLVTGGAGFVGSVVVEELLAQGAERVVILDNLSKGHEGAVVAPARLERGDIADIELVARLVRDERLDAVVHLAASSLVGESVENPGKYYANNVVKGLALLDAIVGAGVRRFVFSSTAAVYGEPAHSPITEDAATAPTNPYGETKLAFERALACYRRAHGLRYVCLRYFNAAGATLRNGEQHESRDAPHPARPCRRQRVASGRDNLRGRLCDSRRNLRSGLHSRVGPRERPRARPSRTRR